MQLERVTFALTEDWNQPIDRTEDGRSVTRRDYEQIDAFAAAVGGAAHLPTSVDPVPLTPLWSGSIVVCEPQDARQVAEQWAVPLAQAYAHIFLLNAPLRPDSIREVQRTGCAGAIEAARYRVWRLERADDPDGGVCGRKDVASRMGARWRHGVWSETDDYCFLVHEGHHGLTALLAAYLVAYADLVP